MCSSAPRSSRNPFQSVHSKAPPGRSPRSHDGDVEPSLGEVGGAHQTVVAAAYDDDVDRHDWRARSTSPVEPRLGQAVRSLAALSGRASGMVRVLASAVMKLESPVQRGTTWTWR